MEMDSKLLGFFGSLFLTNLAAFYWIFHESINQVSDNSGRWPLVQHYDNSLHCNPITCSNIKTYSRDQLLNLQTSRGLLSPDAIVNIKNCAIKKKTRGKRSGLHTRRKKKVIQQGVNWNNLCRLKVADFTYKNNNALIIHQANVRSIHNKDHILRQSILGNNIDASFVSETWLRDHESCTEEHAWIDCCEINTNGLGFSSVPRKKGRGGGIGLIYKSAYKIRIVKVVNDPDLEAAVWEIKSDQFVIHICGIYRQPSGNYEKFMNLFLELIQNFVDLKKVVILGDFNIHYGSDNPLSVNFMETMSAMGYDQHVNFSTHNKGNILDLVYIDTSGELQAINTRPGLLVSDHYEIITTLSACKKNTHKKTIKYRAYEGIKWEQLYQDAACDDLLKVDLNINELVTEFETKIQAEIDKHAPIKEKRVSVRRHQPWFNDEIKSAKQNLQKLEKKWRSSRSDLDHTNYMQCRKEYQWKLKNTKEEIISSKFTQLQGDGKKAFPTSEQSDWKKSRKRSPRLTIR